MIDASLAAGAFFTTQLVPHARQLLSEQGVALMAPSICRGEVYNAGLRLVRRGVASSATVAGWLADFDELPVRYLEGADWVDRAYAIALRFRQPSVFDAVYLACAEDLDAELWTADRRFVASFGGERPDRLRLCPDDVHGR